MLNARKLSLGVISSWLSVTALLAIEVQDLAPRVEAQQQVGSQVGCRVDGVDRILASSLDPSRPQGRSDADLTASVTRHGASGSGTLNSRFQEGQFTIKGLAGASAVWRDPPPRADQTNAGAAVMFLARWETGSVPLVFRCDGSIGASLADKRRPVSRPALVQVKLSTGAGVLLWQQQSDGTDGETLKAASFHELLAPNQEYRFAVYAQAEAASGREQEALQSLAAWFDLEAQVAAGPAAETASPASLLVVVTPELKILQLDGKPIEPAQLRERQGFREYSLPAGAHAITASFHRVTPVTYESVRDVKGRPASCKHFFRAGHRYAALYRACAEGTRAPRGWVQRLARDLSTPRDEYWSMEIVDLDDLRRQMDSTHPRDSLPVESTESRPANAGAGDTAPDGPMPGAGRLGLTPEVVSAVRRYLALDTRTTATEEARERSEPPASPVSPGENR